MKEYKNIQYLRLLSEPSAGNFNTQDTHASIFSTLSICNMLTVLKSLLVLQGSLILMVSFGKFKRKTFSIVYPINLVNDTFYSQNL